jgi:two-component system, sensor histidine kinase YesM
MIKKLFWGLFEFQIATKTAVTILIVVFISTFFTSVFSYISSTNVVKENVRESSIQIARQAADSLSFILSTGSDMSDFIYSNRRLQEIVIEDANPTLPIIERGNNNEYFNSFLNSNIYSSSFVRIIYVLKEEGTSWGSGTFSPHKLSKYRIPEMDWARNAIAKDGEVVWGGLQYDRFSGAGENTQLILPVSRVMKDFTDLKNIGYIQVALDGSAILEKIEQLKLGKTGQFFVVDDRGDIMVDRNVSNITKPIDSKYETLHPEIITNQTNEFEFKHDGTEFYGVKQPISNGWTIVGVVPISEITGELTHIRRLTVLMSLIIGIVAMLAGIYLSRKVIQPINQLTNQMKLVGEGNFKVRTNIRSNDEIGLMSLQFNHMLSQIERLLHQVNEEQDKKKEAELRALRHRINPHFLFNTLSTIRWLVKFNQTEKANTALSALIRLLEANMGKKGTFITIKEELDIIEKFMAIMQIRYEQTFHLQLHIDEEIEEFMIPQMLLQPIVENAIFHGFVPTGKEGTITITAKRLEDEIRIIVHDNGVGVKKEALEHLKETGQAKSFVGIGLLHVFDSVNLYFASGSKVDIESNENGTFVILCLKPKNGVEEIV